MLNQSPLPCPIQIYIDTSLILEALEHFFPASAGYGTLYPSPSSSPVSASSSSRPLIRLLASYWSDRPLFRVTTGLIPASVWRTHFGTDRANLIGHTLDAEKLGRKVVQNLSGLDLQLSLIEELFSSPPIASEGEKETRKWIFTDAETPSLADVAVWYQLDWGEKISRGEGIHNLTGGGTRDGDGEGIQSVFNKDRYPGLTAWFERFRDFMANLPNVESRIEKDDNAGVEKALQRLKQTTLKGEVPLLPTPTPPHAELDARNGLVAGVEVTIAPDDTGRDSPTLGKLVAITPEEVVVTPQGSGSVGDVRIHFPRVGFVVRPTGYARL